MNDKFFTLIFTFMMICMVAAFSAAIFLSVKCYTSNDPNSIACFMISERHEIGVRNR